MRVVVRVTILERVIAFVMVLGGGALLLAALGLIAATQWLDRLLGSLPMLGPATGWLLAAVTSLILAAITFTFLFRPLPPVPIRWRDVWLAALLCAATWVVAGELLVLRGLLVVGSQSAYGALGGVLAVMLWMNVVSQTLFFGAELCKVVATRGTHS
jgi:membrane protein